MYANRKQQENRRAAGRSVRVRRLRRHGQAGYRLLLLGLSLLPGLAMAVPAGTVIDNTATATFGGGIITRSNTVTTVTVIARTPSTIEFLRYAPFSPTAVPVVVNSTDYSTSGTAAGPFAPLPPPVPSGSTVPLDLSAPLPLATATMYHQGDPVFLRLTDPDQNRDALLVETVLVTVTSTMTGDTELLRLTETGPDSGVFTAFIQSYAGMTNPAAANPANGQFGLHDGDTVTANYVDIADAIDTATTSSPVDPFGLVFDSSTGTLVDGAQITLIDAASGLPATVYGDDGISSFPSTITSGGSTTDSSGRTYSFGTGEYRYPFVAPGTYILQVSAPAGYSAPSVVPDAVLQALPGAPFAIDVRGSRGLSFVVAVGPAIQVDIPVDPDTPGFFLVKEVDRRVAAAGDFLQYRLRISNGAGVVATGTQVIDTLPPGMRYQPGSATRDGSPVADPAIGVDGRTLTFDTGDIIDGAIAELRYVVEITAGSHAGEAVNHAVASANAGSLVSNEGTATVHIREDFLRSRNVLMGRVIADDCAAPGSEPAQGVAGVRIYLENGTSVVTDEYGRFHIEGVRAGSHVVQMDLETLAPQFEPVVCDEHSRFAGRTFSRFIDLQGGTLWRTDFHVKALPPPVADVQLAVESSVEDHVVTWHLALQGGDVPLENMRLMINLQETTDYLPGSSVLDNTAIADPEVRGRVMIYDLGRVDGAWQKQLNFLAAAEVKGETELLPGKAFLLFDSPDRRAQRTPVVETVVKRIRHDRLLRDDDGSHFDTFIARPGQADRQALDRIAAQLRTHRVLRIEATGHTDNVPIRDRSRGTFADNFALSVARARSVADYLASQLDLPADAVVIRGLGATRPLASNRSADGRAKNRRVDLAIVTETMLDAAELSGITPNDSITVEVTGAWRTAPVASRRTSSEEVLQPVMPRYDQAWVDSAAPGTALLWPPADYNPPIPSIRIAVKHAPAQQVTLLLNDRPVSALNFDTRRTSAAGTVAVSQWAGVDIERGGNRLVVEIRDAAGALVERIERDVRMSSLPVRAELVAEQSRLLADGRQTPVIAVRLFDRDGRPVREGLIGEFRVEPPHVAQQDIDDLQRQPLAGLDRGSPRYRVGQDGIALIELKPTTRTGEATLVIPLAQREARLKPWLTAAPRDWILVGLAEGTVAHNTVSGNLTSLSAAGLEQDTWTDGKTSFFARGSIKGEWLLTLAYDSAKDSAERDTLFQEIDPDTYYPVYGDGSAQDYDAASRDKLFVRLERRQFYALFGDYQTGLTVTELARYDRSLTGYRSELRSDHFDLNVFASDSGQNFVRDEIQGDGTSGLYHLSFPDLVYNSDKIRIETRDRFRPQLVLSSRSMTRNLDYNIDYDAGTLFFRQPVPSRDASLNPVYIVVDYETRNDGASQWSYGGRGAVRLPGGRAEVGATFINQGSSSGDDTLMGVDATVDVTASTQLKLEYATTEAGAAGTKDAWLAEVQHTSGRLEGSVYVRERQSGFGLEQQSSIGAGTRIIGADARYHRTDRLDYTAQAFRQTDLQTDAERDVVEAGVAYDTGVRGATAGVRVASDTYTTGTDNTSGQLLLGAHQALLDRRLNLRIDHHHSVIDNDNPDYPTRTVLGADYLLNPSTSLFLEQELTFGAAEDTRGTRIGMMARPWTGATLNTALEQRLGEYGPRLLANAGLQQAWQVTDHWSMAVGIDSSRTIREPGNAPFSTALPPASGSSEDFTAVSLGGTWQDDTWSWTSRIEHRTADSQDKWGLYSGAAGEPRAGLGLSARLQVFDTQSPGGIESDEADLRLGLVHRPFGRRWTLLNRTDLAIESRRGGGSDSDNWKIVNNLMANYRVRGNQVSGYYGARYSRDTFDDVDYAGYTDSVGIEARHDIGRHWDVGARASTLHSWNDDQYDYSYGVSAGVSPATNVWVTAGYNWSGYEDHDFTLAGHTAAGPYVTLRFKIDQQSVRDTINWFNR